MGIVNSRILLRWSIQDTTIYKTYSVNFEVAEKRYNGWFSDVIEFNDTRFNLTSSQSNLFFTCYTYLIVLARSELATGVGRMCFNSEFRRLTRTAIGLVLQGSFEKGQYFEQRFFFSGWTYRIKFAIRFAQQLNQRYSLIGGLQ